METGRGWGLETGMVKVKGWAVETGRGWGDVEMGRDSGKAWGGLDWVMEMEGAGWVVRIPRCTAKAQGRNSRRVD